MGSQNPGIAFRPSEVKIAAGYRCASHQQGRTQQACQPEHGLGDTGLSDGGPGITQHVECQSFFHSVHPAAGDTRALPPPAVLRRQPRIRGVGEHRVQPAAAAGRRRLPFGRLFCGGTGFWVKNCFLSVACDRSGPAHIERFKGQGNKKFQKIAMDYATYRPVFDMPEKAISVPSAHFLPVTARTV